MEHFVLLLISMADSSPTFIEELKFWENVLHHHIVESTDRNVVLLLHPIGHIEALARL